MFRAFFLLVVILLLEGCANTIKSRVSVFHELNPEAKTFAFTRLKEQEGGLEHKRYEELVRSQLISHNYKEVPINDAELVVGIVYVTGSHQFSRAYPIFGQTGVSSSRTYGTLSTYGSMGTYSGTTTYTPTYGVVGSGVATSTEYTYRLNVTIFDGIYLRDNSKVRVVYEGKVVSEGSAGELSVVMPYLVEALFQEFPGNDGSTRMITLPIKRQ